MSSVLIKEIGRVITGNTPSKSNEVFYESDDIGFIKPDIISEDKITYIKSPKDFISEQARSKARIVCNRAVLVTCIGSIGKIGIIDGGEYAFNQQINAIEPNEKVSSEYLAYCLLYNRDRLAHIANAPVVPIINKTQFENFRIHIVDEREEQNQIVERLNKISNAINMCKEQIEKYDLLIKSRFVEMFGDEKSFDIWKCCLVGEVADVCVGVVIKPTQYYTDKSEGIRAFRSLNVGCMNVKDNDWVYFTKEGHEKNHKSIIRENDVLVVRSGAPGTACVATSKFTGSNAIDIIIAHPKVDKINPVFLAMFTNMPHGMNQIREKIGGAAQQHFNVGEYKMLKLFCPPIGVQNQFAAFVQQVDKMKSTTQKSIDKLQILFDSLMQKYFG